MFKKQLKQIKHSESGSLLLMSILILSGIMTAASSVGIITIQSLKQSSLIDNGIHAFYAAESGVEDALYEIRKNETATATVNGGTGFLSNSSRWSRTVSTTITQRVSDIDENDFWHIDLYNPDSSISSIANPVKSLKLSWTGGGAEWVEVQIIPWDTSGVIGTPSEQIFSSASSGGAIVNLQDLTTALYRVRIKALYSDITDMTVTAYGALNALGGTEVDVPGFLTIYSTGTFSRANQVVRAQMPHRAPLSGQFGYVLFAEQDIIK
jgi:hypothetical protein